MLYPVKLGESYRTLRDEIADDLRRRILDGSLAPGDRLHEAALAEELGVSRIPLREAFRSLESEGLLSWLPRRGVRVVGIDAHEAEAVEEIRLQLELIAVRFASARRNALLDEALRSFLEEGSRAARERDSETLSRLNGRFHQLLAEGSGSALLQRLLQTARQRSDQLRPSPDGKRIRSSWRDHAAIVRHLLDGETADAEAKMEAHLRSHRGAA
jgi:DNA-binding GntR family transcriptional regulator